MGGRVGWWHTTSVNSCNEIAVGPNSRRMADLLLKRIRLGDRVEVRGKIVERMMIDGLSKVIICR